LARGTDLIQALESQRSICPVARKLPETTHPVEDVVDIEDDALRHPPERAQYCSISARPRRSSARYELAKLFDIAVTEDGFTFGRNPARIADEARLHGFYVIRTSVETGTLAADNVVGAYKGLARVERAFRSHEAKDTGPTPSASGEASVR
jgi:hypothetical protein